MIPSYKDSEGPADTTFTFDIKFDCEIKLFHTLSSDVDHIFGVDPLPHFIPFSITQTPNCGAEYDFPEADSSPFFDVSVEPEDQSERRALVTHAGYRRLSATSDYNFKIDKSASFDLEQVIGKQKSLSVNLDFLPAAGMSGSIKPIKVTIVVYDLICRP